MARTANAFVSSITPFDTSGAILEDDYRRHLRRLAAAGVGVLVGGSGTGEAYTLSGDELRRVIEISVEELKGLVPVRAMGHEPRTPAEMIDFVQMAEAAGVDAVQIYSLDPGHMYLPSSREIESYLSSVLDTVSIPTVISSHMSVGYLVPTDVIERLLQRYDSIVGMIVTNADAQYVWEVGKRFGDQLEIIGGGSCWNMFQWQSVGFSGFGTSEGNIAPRLCRAVIDAYLAGDLEEWMRLTGVLYELNVETRRYGYVSGVKAALKALGLPGGVPRRPRLPVPDDSLADIRASLTRLGIPEIERLA